MSDSPTLSELQAEKVRHFNTRRMLVTAQAALVENARLMLEADVRSFEDAVRAEHGLVGQLAYDPDGTIRVQ